MIHPAPKPVRRELDVKERKWLRRQSWMKPGMKPIPKINKNRTAKRRASAAKFYRSKPWQVIRELAFRAANRQCQVCGTADRLEVHHVTYARFGGRELPDDLLVLCVDCHRREEATNHWHRQQHRQAVTR